MRFSILSAFVAFSCAIPVEAQLPTGGSIASGAATIQQSGAAMTINQSSQKLGLNWQSFNIGAGNSVNFIQPNASSVALNRVLGNNASSIFGSLQANGSVFLINPNGVLFAPGAQVNVGGLVASTLGLSDADFASGNYPFTNSGNAGSVINQGHIQAGNVALLGPQIVNSGIINAANGSVVLAAGDAITVKLLDSGLLTAHVDRAALNASIQNHGQIFANGGQVQLLADAIQDSLLNTDGLIQAKSLVNKDGRIYLSGGSNGTTTVSGTLDASGGEAGAHGGGISVLGKQVGLMAGATLDASGNAGGGTVLVGGNWHGERPEQNASATYMDKNATIHAGATQAGNGGQVVLWSNDYTGFYGNISAKGGPFGGAGGNVETSSHNNLQAFGLVDTSAIAGPAGNWLLDPADVTILSSDSGYTPSGGNPNVFTPNSGASTATINTATINSSLNAGTSVTITTTNSGTAGSANGDITMNGAAAITKSAGGDATLLLQADRNIIISPGASITSTSGKLNLTLDAHYSNNSAVGAVAVGTGSAPAVTINTNGGNLVIGGGSDPTTMPAIGAPGFDFGRGVFVFVATLDAGGGNIIINGQGAASGSNDEGVNIAGNATSIVTSGSGTIAVTGTASGGSNAVGVWLASGGGTLKVSTGSGALSITGTGATEGIGGGGGTVDIFSTSGPITLSATSLSALNAPFSFGQTVNVGWDGGSNVTTGDVSILGQTASGSSLGANGLNVPSFSIKGNGGNLTIGSTGSGLTGMTLSSTNIASGSTWNTMTIGDTKTGTVVSNQALAANSNVSVTSQGATTLNAAVTSTGGNVTLTAGYGQPVSPTSVPNGSVTGGDVTLGAAVQAGAGKTVTIYSGNATTSAYNTRISGSSSSLNKAYATVAGAGAVDPSKILNAFYRVSPAALTVSGVTAANKVYDGTTAATMNTGSATVNGQIDGDNFGVSSIGAFVTRNVGSGITVNLTNSLVPPLGTTINGYPFNPSGTTTANITPAPITVSAISNTKTYDGNTSAAATPSVTSGSLFGTDTFSTRFESYASRNAGTGLTLVPTVAINDGNSGNNYTVTKVNNTSGIITTAPLTLTANAATKTYDGTTASSVLPTLAGLIGGDTASGNGVQTYSTRNAGTGLTLTPGAGTLAINDGNGGNNYAFTMVNNTNGVINQAPLTLTANADTKTYDGTTASSAIPALSGLVGGDTASGNGVQTYSTRNAGTGLTLTPGAGTLAINDGNGGNNYALTMANNTNGVINPAPLTITAVSNTKTYDGTTSAGASPIVTGALAGGDTFTTLAEAYASKNVGTSLTLSPVVAINDGNGGNNYALAMVNSTNGVINPLAITVTAVANSKVYDGTTSGTVAPQITSGSIAPGDTPGFVETYNTKNVGSGWTLTPSGIVNDGNSGNNYAVTFIGNSGGVITPLSVQVALKVAGGRVYDATTTADSSYLQVTNNVDGPNLILGGIGTMTSANAGPEPLLSSGGSLQGFSLSGSAASNYTLFGASGTVVVSPRPVNVIGSRMYDGTAGALSSLLSVTNPIAGETVTVTSGSGTLASKNVGSQAIASMGDLALSDANYTTAGGSGTVTISPAPITVAAIANTKTYDGTIIAVSKPVITSGALMGTDTFATLSETYTTKNVGTGLTLTPNVAINDGNGGNNYALTTLNNANGVINQAALLLIPNGVSVPYTGIALNNTAYSNLLSSYTVMGLQGDDTLASLGLSLSGSMAFNGNTATLVQNPGAYLFGAGTLSPSLTSSNYTIAFANPPGNAYTITRGMDPNLFTAGAIASSDASMIGSQMNAHQQQLGADAFDDQQQHGPDPSEPKCLLALEGGTMKLPAGLSDDSSAQLKRACRANR